MNAEHCGRSIVGWVRTNSMVHLYIQMAHVCKSSSTLLYKIQSMFIWIKMCIWNGVQQACARMACWRAGYCQWHRTSIFQVWSSDKLELAYIFPQHACTLLHEHMYMYLHVCTCNLELTPTCSINVAKQCVDQEERSYYIVHYAHQLPLSGPLNNNDVVPSKDNTVGPT